MRNYPEYSHGGITDSLTHCAAPPLLYSHLDRMISGSNRTGAVLTLASISISLVSGLDQILAMAHTINQMMRKEDLCGRMGHFQFVIVISGNRADGEKLLKRIRNSTSVDFRSELVQWAAEETSLHLLHQLDLATEISLE